jgi:hypothetical protein
MKFRETRFDPTRIVVIVILTLATLVIIGMIVAKLTRGSSLV